MGQNLGCRLGRCFCFAKVATGNPRPYATNAEPNQHSQTGANRCHWCGKDHSGNFFQKIIGFFHNIFAKIFGNKY